MNTFEIGQKVRFYDFLLRENLNATIIEVLPGGLYRVKLDDKQNECIINGNDLELL